MRLRIVLAALMVLALIAGVFSSAQINKNVENVKENTEITVDNQVEFEIVTEQTTESESTAENQNTQTQDKETDFRAKKEKNNKAQPVTGYNIENSNEDWVTPGSKKLPKKEEEKKEEKQPEKVTVTLSINCKNAVDKGFDIAPYLLDNAAYTAEEGATVFDALKALCDENSISLKYQRKTYIQGIGGLNEKDCGDGSGWTYLVNGVKPTKPSSSYVFKDGDVIEFRYVTNSNE